MCEFRPQSASTNGFRFGWTWWINKQAPRNSKTHTHTGARAHCSDHWKRKPTEPTQRREIRSNRENCDNPPPPPVAPVHDGLPRRRSQIGRHVGLMNLWLPVVGLWPLAQTSRLLHWLRLLPCFVAVVALDAFVDNWWGPLTVRK